jgi:hypothetical protein
MVCEAKAAARIAVSLSLNCRALLQREPTARCIAQRAFLMVNGSNIYATMDGKPNGSRLAWDREVPFIR